MHLRHYVSIQPDEYCAKLAKLYIEGKIGKNRLRNGGCKMLSTTRTAFPALTVVIADEKYANTISGIHGGRLLKKKR